MPHSAQPSWISVFQTPQSRDAGLGKAEGEARTKISVASLTIQHVELAIYVKYVAANFESFLLILYRKKTFLNIWRNWNEYPVLHHNGAGLERAATVFRNIAKTLSARLAVHS
jgi:hypothetical protein